MSTGNTGTILLFGANGLLGSHVNGILVRSAGVHRVMAPGRDICDLLTPNAAYKLITLLRPSIVINCAGMANVDECEEKPDQADRLNAAVVHEMALACAKVRARLIHISTDYVFVGGEEMPPPHHYTAESSIKLGRDNAGVYARTKSHGEAYAGLCDNHCIVRTSWLFGNRLDGRKTFPEWFVDQVVGGLKIIKSEVAVPKQIPMITDRRGSPTYVPDAAQAVVLLSHAPWIGVAHVCNGTPSDVATLQDRERYGFTSSQEDFGSYAIRTFGEVHGGPKNPLFAEVAKNFDRLFKRMVQQELVDAGIWKVLRPTDTRLIPSDLGGFLMRPFDDALRAFWQLKRLQPKAAP